MALVVAGMIVHGLQGVGDRETVEAQFHVDACNARTARREISVDG